MNSAKFVNMRKATFIYLLVIPHKNEGNKVLITKGGGIIGQRRTN